MLSVLLLLFVVEPVGAVTVEFSDPLNSNQIMIFYQVQADNGTVEVGRCNTTMGVMNLSEGTYQVVLKPSGAGVLQNPITTIDWLTAALVLIFGLAIILAIAFGSVMILIRFFRGR